MKDEHGRNSRSGRSRLSSRAIALMRKSKLWVKTDKRLVLNSVVVEVLDKGEKIILRDEAAAQAL
eukprot:7379009-Karenia_brevis.AAC.1